MGAGGLQALVKSGLPIRGKRVVVAGSGPLLLAVAAYLRQCGADVRLIAEQAPLRRLLGFALTLSRYPGKVGEAIKLKTKLAGVRHFAGCWPVAASGGDQLSGVTLRQGQRTWTVPCDYLACGFHLLPNLELAHLLGCRIDEGAVFVDEFQETSISGVYCAGESTGIGGLELSLVEGQIAGHAAAGNRERCRQLFSSRQKYRRFAGILNRTFELRNELKGLSAPQTIVCRCEDVTFASLGACNSWREAKMQTRCGMGPCQGRVCGAALEFLMSWKPDSIRPPIIPVRLDSFLSVGADSRVLADGQ